MKKNRISGILPEEIAGTAAALLWLAVFPLWTGGSYAHITRDKWTGLLWLAGCSAALCLLSLFLRWRGKKRGGLSAGMKTAGKPAAGMQMSGEKPAAGVQTPGGKPTTGVQTPGGKPAADVQMSGGKPATGMQMSGGKPATGVQTSGGKPAAGMQTFPEGQNSFRRRLPADALIPCVLGGLYLLWLCLAARFGSWHGQLNDLGQPVVLFGVFRYEGLLTALAYAAVFFCLLAARPRLRAVCLGAAVALDLAALLAALQYLDLNPLGLFPEGTGILRNYEFQSTIGNIDFVTEYLCLMIPLLLGGWLLTPRGGFFLASALVGVMWLLCMEVQGGLLALLAVCAGALLLAVRSGRFRSRALGFLAGVFACFSLRKMIRFPWLDGVWELGFIPSAFALLLLIPAALLLAAALFFARRPGRDLPWRIILIAALAAVLLAGFFFLQLRLPASSGALWEIQQTLKGRPRDSFGSYRFAVWHYALRLAGESPVFGLGPGTFYYALKDLLHAEEVSLPQSFDSPHNMALSVLVDGGFPALILWLCLMGFLIVRGLRRGGWHAVLALSLAACLVDGLFAFPACVVTPVFWAVAGLCGGRGA